MAEYTVVKLNEIENPAARFGLDPEKIHLGFGRRHLQSETLGVSYLRLAPGFRPPFGHKHGVQEEVYVLVNGSARLKVGDEIVELTPFTAVRLAPSAMRAVEAGPEGAELILVGAPDPGEQTDAELTPGWWSD